MARSLEEIKNQIIQRKESYEELNGLTSTSLVSVWLLWVDVVAFTIWNLETIFDAFKEIVQDLLRQLLPHTPRWYRNKALAFQYGFDLIADSDKFNNTGRTAEEIAASKIIKYAAVVEAEDESRLIVKIATETTELTPVEPAVFDAFVAYMKEIRDAGVRITVINYLPDLLDLKIRIFRDELVLDENGVNRIDGNNPVEDALQDYMKELPFNGELVLQSLANKLEEVEGVNIVQIDEALTAWIDAATNSYGNFESIDVRQIPVSGYFKIENFNNVDYVV